jgi:hypothetical protein
MAGRRHTGPEDHLVGLVERADPGKDAFVVREPGLVELTVVAPSM